MKHLKKTLVAGGVVGGLLAGLFLTKKGRQIREQARAYAEDLYGELVKKAGELTELSQEKFEELVEILVKEYSKKKELAEDVAQEVMDGLKAQWEGLQVEGLMKTIAREYRDLEKQTKTGYEEIVEQVVKEYAREKKLALASKTKIARELKKRFSELEG